MLRKFPNQTQFRNPMDGMGQMPMEMFMHPNMQMGGMQMNQMMNPNMMMGGGVDINMVQDMDATAKRDYFGEKLYGKISSNPHYVGMSDMFSKIVGIFLDLEELVIERLINDDTYFDIQVRETMRLLAERGSQST